jgi:hypothetical protein
MEYDFKHTQSDEKSTRENRVRRIKAFIFLLSVAVIGGIVTYFSVTWLREIKELLSQNPEKAVSEFIVFVKVLIVFIVIVHLVFAVYFWRLGSRILTLGEFPPPGALLIRNKKVLVGEQACRMGRLCRALAIVLIVMSTLLPVLLWNLVKAVLREGT